MVPVVAESPHDIRMGSRLLAGLFLGCAVLLISPWRLVDTDALANLATGRHIVEQQHVPSSDPFTFSDPDRPWSNPEWLGQVLWFGAHSLAGEAGVVALKLFLLVAGWLLIWRWAIGLGAPPIWIASLLVICFSFAYLRFVARAEVHLYWLVGAYGLILQSSWRFPRRIFWLLPLALLWANLHSSFVIGWLILGCAVVGYRFQEESGERKRFLRGLLVVMALHPFVALINPHGSLVYEQLYSHLAGASIYREMVIEWRSSLASSNLSFFLYGLTLLGVASFLAKENRRRVYEGCLFLVGLSCAYVSQRFVPLALMLCLPVLAANMARTLNLKLNVSKLRAMSIVLGTVAFAVNAWMVMGIREKGRRPLLETAGTPLTIATFIGRSAPAESRLFNPYNAGPWLLWKATPRVKLYIDPRNNLGARALAHYVDDVLPKPGIFFGEATRLGIGLAMIDTADGRMATLHAALRKHEGWKLGYFDGTYAIYAAPLRRNRQWIADNVLLGLRAQLDLEYLLKWPQQRRREVTSQLKDTAPELAKVMAAYQLLANDAPPPLLPQRIDRKGTEMAEALLLEAMPTLPPSAALFDYLATAARRLGHDGLAKNIHSQSLRLFPHAAHTLARRSVWEGGQFAERIPPNHILRSILRSGAGVQ
jgi:hypothetical protein